MSFVDRFGLPPREEPDHHRDPYTPPAWFGPPADELGVAVHLGAVIGRSERAVVALSQASVFSTGLRLHTVARARGLSRGWSNRILQQDPFGTDDESTDGFLRIGLELPDGTLVSNLGAPMGHPAFDQEPDGPVFFESGGGGGSGGPDGVHLQRAYWLWPLPEPGTIRVSCEWPIVEMPLTTVEIDGIPLVQTADRVVRLW